MNAKEKDLTQNGETNLAPNKSAICNRRFGNSASMNIVKCHLRECLLPHDVKIFVELKSCDKGKYLYIISGSVTNSRSIWRIYVDTKAKIEAKSDDKHYYFITIVEEYSRYTEGFPSKRKI